MRIPLARQTVLAQVLSVIGAENNHGVVRETGGLQFLDDSTNGSVDSAALPDAIPPMWKVRIVSCVPGSPID